MLKKKAAYAIKSQRCCYFLVEKQLSLYTDIS